MVAPKGCVVTQGVGGGLPGVGSTPPGVGGSPPMGAWCSRG